MNSRGLALVQVIVMGMILALIASYLAQWSFGRYQLVARHQSYTAAASLAESCLNKFWSNYHTTLSQAGVLPNVFAFPCPGGGGNVTATRIGATQSYTLTMTPAVNTP